MCHAGLFGFFHAIYIAAGGSCETNHVKRLKTTLKEITKSLKYSHLAIRELHGRLDCFLRTTDRLNPKLNVANDLQIVQDTFKDWQQQLNEFANTEQCRFRMMFEFTSKHSNSVNRAIGALARLTEIQNTLHQFNQLHKETLQKHRPSSICLL